MSRQQKHQRPSPETCDEANKIAKATQRPGQTREQTKLIARGIQKGIEQYKKQQKNKARELDKKRKKPSLHPPPQPEETDPRPQIIYKQHWLPWVLLALTWVGAGILALFYCL